MRNKMLLALLSVCMLSGCAGMDHEYGIGSKKITSSGLEDAKHKSKKSWAFFRFVW